MPVFQLQLRDGDVEPAKTIDLPDADQARLHAIRYVGEALTVKPERVIGHDLRVEVSTADGLLLFSVIVIGVQSAAAQLDRI
ncbi:DUF6894 family protein [Sphingomonas xinjiangensis]|uniref:DUF6894 domain-containing protein n=1 Tax=Sphingomonas xinjiangensis TaxID=643568 RepID=A0A840YJ95_9SPHN|nr:hypothetical protein [Sphingomonas xinjiangensis]MBB5708810.1 hypothetical protein [Sphingomonas xinjiangensis]